jgi:hypothetical protein
MTDKKEPDKADLRKKLFMIQYNLEAPKNQYNSFGGYAYRSCEDILKALKPFLKKYKVCVNLEDEIVIIGERYYIKAKATLADAESNQVISATAYAREAKNKKGMDEAQITGASSSYARKYALNGLFGIDDAKDSDAMNKKDKDTEEGVAAEKLLKKDEMKAIKDILQAINNAKEVDDLSEIGDEIKEMQEKDELSKSQNKVLKTAWTRKYKSLQK